VVSLSCFFETDEAGGVGEVWCVVVMRGAVITASDGIVAAGRDTVHGVEPRVVSCFK
jgi:hypothetical protein